MTRSSSIWTTARAYLALGRVSNLPTVWANVFCAALLSGGASGVLPLLLFIGMTLLYVGGMYLNDVCDVKHDEATGKPRPIPLGQVSYAKAVAATLALLIGGLICFIPFGPGGIVGSSALLTLIVLYNLTHKRFAHAYLIMGACRAAIYLTVAAGLGDAFSPAILLVAGAQWLYIAGITLLARNEDQSNAFNKFAFAPLSGAFVLLAVWPDSGYEPERIFALALIAAWTGFSLFKTRTPEGLVPGKAIAPLLAGIPLLDLAAINAIGVPNLATAILFGAFFVAALLAQRFIPAS